MIIQHIPGDKHGLAGQKQRFYDGMMPTSFWFGAASTILGYLTWVVILNYPMIIKNTSSEITRDIHVVYKPT